MRKERTGSQPGIVVALRRGLQVLETVAESGGQLPLKGISQRVALHLSTTHHLVKTLETLGYLRQDNDRSYRLDRRIFQLAAAAWNGDELAKLGVPLLEELGLKTGETSQLAVFDRRQMLVIETFTPTGPVRFFGRVGTERPAYCTAIGRAVLAYQSPAGLQDYLRATPLKPLTPKTITNVNQLKEELRRVARAGLATDAEEYSQGIRCIAAPVVNFAGTVVAAIGLFGPAWRMSAERSGELIPTVRGTAETLSRELGYGGEYPPKAAWSDAGRRSDKTR